MKNGETKLVTPIFHKTSDGLEIPDDLPVCYVLADNGLFTRRRHRFFTSCVVARDWPSELVEQKQYLNLHCPKLSQEAMERIVGFFSKIADLHGSEAAATLYWDRSDERVCFKIPDQRAAVSEGWNGGRYPSDVRYENPQVDSDLSLFGSVHSHVDGAAYASQIDRTDESHLTGLHIVVGRIRQEPPELHCEYVVDGVRFRVDAGQVIEGYDQRSTDIPDEWIQRVKVDVNRYVTHSYYQNGEYDEGPARRRNR